MSVLSEEEFNYLFAKRNSVYTYKDFVIAVTKFPYACNDKGPARDYLTDEEMCR